MQKIASHNSEENIMNKVVLISGSTRSLDNDEEGASFRPICN